MSNISFPALRGKRICVFCGSRSGRRPDYTQAAVHTGEILARSGAHLVFGGGRIGIMGILADTVLAHGGQVISVIPEYLRSAEVDHPGATEHHVVEDLFERKRVMMQLSDAFLTLPGSLGTFDEFLEVLTWRQLGRHDKPIGVLNTADYFVPMLQAIDHAVAEEFLSARYQDMMLIESDPAQLFGRIATVLAEDDDDD
ncbi:MAG: TIGR00730 family Rossman fold protein [Gammaproteobacteria bacterium]|nr:TIGR00730 family Rossman fold protein [Gammaproteobacteria bacterium]